jgi:uncharacterized protein (DUF2461 family)
MHDFQGFPKDGLALLGQLPGLSKGEFGAVKARYQAEIADPTKAFVDALGSVLQGTISPAIEFAAKTNGSIGPINNDLRFNPDAPRYKDHLLLRFWEGTPKKVVPNLYVRLTPTEVGFATGQAFPDVPAWRDAVAARGAELSDALASLVSEAGATVVGQELKRVPAPFPADHPQGDLLRHKWLQVRWSTPHPASIHDAGFADVCAEELRRAAPIHRWLVEASS